MNERLYSPSHLKAVLEKFGFSFKKFYGQNFLIDGNIVKAIVNGAKIGKDEYRKKKYKWNSECLMRYKNFVEILNNSSLQDKDNLIQMTYDIVFKDNVVNFHNVSGSHKNEIIDNFIAHPEKPHTHSDIREAFADFCKAAENEPIKPITMYEELEYEPIEIQIAVKETIQTKF